MKTLVFIFSLSIIVIAYTGTGHFYNNVNEKQQEIIQHAVERAAVQCFALEGAFPPNIEYLERYYGLKVDKDRFIYDYSVFSSNIRPEIRIFKKY